MRYLIYFSDAEFANEMIDKYYDLYKQNIIFGCSNTNSTVNTVAMSSSSNTMVEHEDFQESDNEQDHENGLITEDTITEDIEARNYLIAEDDELLITLVSAKPPLYDFRMPLRERSRETIQKLWEEIISIMNGGYRSWCI